MPRKTASPACPICGDPADKSYKPFCSRRCADVDLGRWLKGKYAIPGEPVDPRSRLETEEDGN
ncbi:MULTISPECIES: DNA gyrase inhibitor YacG [Euryhalocaulis]|uniref:DNA gyrase inhibitor YacG n=1 Tax=Euryhalocaulis TaxID=1712422 RepID=UPI0003A6B763|nr:MULTISPECIES: DNA gyrase inhibitor YacG [Euryhalocaulis]MBA4801483.1 DNA gyrase inhibitor YacG [Euryhalocaulis sp.]